MAVLLHGQNLNDANEQEQRDQTLNDSNDEDQRGQTLNDANEHREDPNRPLRHEADDGHDAGRLNFDDDLIDANWNDDLNERDPRNLNEPEERAREEGLSAVL